MSVKKRKALSEILAPSLLIKGAPNPRGFGAFLFYEEVVQIEGLLKGRKDPAPSFSPPESPEKW